MGLSPTSSRGSTSGSGQTQIARTNITTSTNFTATTPAAANSIATVTFLADGTTTYVIQVYAPELAKGTTYAIINLWDDGGPTDLGRIVENNGITGMSVFGQAFVTPTSGSHTYSIRGWVNAGTGSFTGGSGSAMVNAILRVVTA